MSGSHFVDADTLAPESPSAPTGLRVSDEFPWDVRLSWEASVAPEPPRYRYRVVAVRGGLSSAPSAPVEGHRLARPVIGYQVQVDGDVWRDVAGAMTTTWTHADASPPSIEIASINASDGTYAEFVRLSSEGIALHPGMEHRYVLRAVTAFGPGSSSGPVSGRRQAGALSYRWERSADSARGDFGPLSGADAPSFDDTGAPADGSARWYRLALNAEGAAEVVSAADVGSRTPPPGVPGGVSATQDLSDRVHVSWQPVDGAVSYLVSRDGQLLTTSAGVAATSFDDLTAPAPEGNWGIPTELEASSSFSDRVELSWESPPRPRGAVVSYQVQAVNAAGPGPRSAEATGRRAATALAGFEVEVTPASGSPSWYLTGSAEPAWAHLDPPYANIIAGAVSATQGAHRGFVRLASEPATITEAPWVAYRVRAVLVDGVRGPASSAASGRRAVGALEAHWERSSGEEPEGFEDLLGSSAVYDDEDAPASGGARWYRLQLDASGATPTVAGPARGWRLAFETVDGARAHTCALTVHGRVWCWGDNGIGELGRGVSQIDIQPPGPVLGLEEIVEIAAAGWASCARASDGELSCWGRAWVGDGTDQDRFAPVPVLANTVGVALGENVGCAVIVPYERVRCWGLSGLLGNGSSFQEDPAAGAALSPVAVVNASGVGLSQVLTVSAGGNHVCAVTDSGELWCWGNLVTLGAQPNPAQILFVTGTVVAAAVNPISTCAMMDGGGVGCWGVSSYGVLGVGPNTTGLDFPTTVMGIDSAVQLAAGDRGYCVRLAGGGVSCWGDNSRGQVGDGSSAPLRDSPVAVGGLNAVSWVGSGFAHRCAVQGGDVWCWGANDRGQLGDDSGEDSPLARRVVFP